MVKENIKGQEIDEDESVTVTATIRQNGKFMKVEYDVSEHYWLDYYKSMVKQPPYQIWVKATEEEKQRDRNAKGHWEKIATPSK